MSPSSRQTLQLRHQLTCADVTLQSAAYDTTRHHVLTYDSRALAPHALRLFSLRRELKTAQLFDDHNPPPPLLPPSLSTKQSSNSKNSKGSSSNTTSGSGGKELSAPVVLSISLEYSATNDVFICMYSAQSVPAARARSKRSAGLEDHAVFNVLFLEPATLKKLVHYPGPPSHRLQCVHFDVGSDCLVLAIHRRQQSGSASNSATSRGVGVSVSSNQQSKGTRSQQYRDEDDGGDGDGLSESDLQLGTHGPMHNHIDVLRISKREFETAKREDDESEEPVEQRRVMLCVEKARPSLLHSETIDLVRGSDRLARLFGVGWASPGWRADADNFLVEWRENSEQQFELVRRVMFRDAVSALAVSPCSKWLYSGHESGALRVWNVGQQHTPVGTEKWTHSYALGSSPLETESTAWHTTPITTICVFRSSDSPGAGSDNCEELDLYTSAETMVITADRDRGVVKHWRFQAEAERTHLARDDLAASIDLVGVYSCDSDTNTANQSGHANKGKSKKTLVESVLTTIPICVNIDMGGFVERLLLVLRADVIHVLKVQAVMHVLQTTSRGDEISAVRVVGRRLVTLSGDRISSLHVLEPSSVSTSRSTCVAPPASHRSSTISAMECFATSRGRSFVVLGWSAGGVVEVRSVDSNTRVLMLQDPRLNTWISAINVVLQSTVSQASSKPAIATPLPRVTESISVRSFGGLLRSTVATANGTLDCLDTNAAQVGVSASSAIRDQAPTVYVFAGTECGHIFGWRLPIDLNGDPTSGSERLVLEAKHRVNNAHSAHVVQIMSFPSRTGLADRIASLGADGMVKVWEVPSLTLLGYVNTTAERHTSMPSCMGFIGGVHSYHELYLVVGFEDGMLAVWSVDENKISFDETQVSSHHERRVTRVSALDRASERGVDFVTCSLDMTAIVWTIKAGSVEERRYFDIGAPAVDICTLGNRAIVALANEVCAFEYCAREASDVVDEMFRSTPFDSARNREHLLAAGSGDNKVEEPTPATDALVLDDTEVALLETDVRASELSLPELSGTAVADVPNIATIDSARADDTLAAGAVEDSKTEEHGTTRARSLHLDTGFPAATTTASTSSDLLAGGSERGKTVEETVATGRKSLHVDIGTPLVDVRTPESLVIAEGIEKVEKVVVPARKKKTRKPSVAESIGLKAREEFPDDTLVSRLKLSQCFQQHWSGGYCWCSSSSELRVSWNEMSAEEPHPTCDVCHNRIHSLALKKTGYKPHFSLRAILGIIADVYQSVVAPSHSLLFKSASRSSVRAPESVSLHSALFRVLTAKFGMQSVVEEKIKLFLVSALHYVHEVDAIAVFGELLAMFADSASDAHVPDEMVALCVCCYSWFFSRAMVVNGDLIIGSGHETRKRVFSEHQDTTAELERGKSTCWQFVNLQNALLCAQEMLVYPLVSPGYLRSILTYTGEYAQVFPTRPTAAGELAQDAVDSFQGEAKWIEIHRFLRLLVGEWKQQNSEFRLAEQTLFAHPLSTSASSNSDTEERRAEVVEKLRLILSCFVFYDHSREGVMTVHDFTSILRKLRYLWPNENVTAEEAENETSTQLSLTFENTILAAKRRFADRDGDGQICYLDFWAMLYIVGIRTLSLLKFREIPSFCKDYKLEIAPDLHDLLQCYMGRSSTMMLPRGFQLGKSSLDQRAAVQHQRRVRGLHDGLFTMPTGLGTSLSLQELIRMGDTDIQQPDPKDQLYLEGTAPALAESSSVTAMDRFRPLTRESEDNKGKTMYSAGPVVVGVRQTGPRMKPRAYLSVSAMTNDALPVHRDAKHTAQGVPFHQETQARQSIGGGSTSVSSSAFSNTYIQFPFVRPHQKRVAMPANDETSGVGRRAVERMQPNAAIDMSHHGVYDWPSKILQEHEDDELASQQTIVPNYLSVKREHPELLPPRRVSFKDSKAVAPHAAVRDDSLKREKNKKDAQAAGENHAKVAVSKTRAGEPRPSVKKEKSKSTVVVIPHLEKEPVRLLLTTSPAVVETAATNTTPVKHNADAETTAAQVEKTDAGARIEALPPTPSISLDSIPTDSEFYQPEQWTPHVHDTVDDALLFKSSEPATAPFTVIDALPVEEPGAREFTNASVDDERPRESDNPVSPTSSPPTHEEESAPSPTSARREDDDMNADTEDDTNQDDGDEGESEEQDSTDAAATIEVCEHDEGVSLATVKHPTNVPFSPDADVDKPLSSTTVVQPSDPAAPPAQAEMHRETTATSSPQPQVDGLAVHGANTDTFDPKQHLHQLKSSADNVNLMPPVHDQREATKPIGRPTAPNVATRTTSAIEQPLKGANYHHSFRFSQQPAFRSTAPVFNNPLRSGQWAPSDDSDSDEDKRAASRSEQDGAAEDEGEYDDVDDIELKLTPEALQAYRAAFGPRMRWRGANQPGLPTLRHLGLAVSAASQLSRVPPRRDLSRDSDLNVTRCKPELEAAAPWQSGNSSSVLYDEQPSPCVVAGGDIAFSSEAEQQMHQKWLAFFSQAEAAMFSPLKQELRDREEAQRLHEEKQSRLMKKRQEQQAQDTLRLQQSRRQSTTLKAPSHDATELSSLSVTDLANFRQRRMTRESCQELQNELRFGESVAGELVSAGDVQYFFFEYDPSVHGSILTLRLDTERGEAEIFMSTETRAPCVSDYMWRSVDKSKGLGEGDGQKLTLYSHDLANAAASARANTAGGDQEEVPVVVSFYVSVVASEPTTKFAVAVMASGQKMEPSHAVTVVDTLIQQFNALSKSLQSPAPARFDPPATLLRPVAEVFDEISESGAVDHHRSVGGSLDRTMSRRRQQMHDDEDESSPEPTEPRQGGALKHDDRGSGKDSAENSDASSEEEDADSFQRLLESVSEKRGFGARKSKSFLLSGPTSDQFEFVQDEVANFEDAVARYSPERVRSCDEAPGVSKDGAPIDSSTLDASSNVAAGDRLPDCSFASRAQVAARRRTVKSARHRLSPLKGVNAAALPSKAAATALRMAKFAPKPVAYSLSSLDRSSSSHLRVSKSISTSQLPSRHTVLPTVHSTSSLK